MSARSKRSWSSELSALSGRYGLDDDAFNRLDHVVEALSSRDRWSPTNVVSPNEVCRIHIADSLSVLEIGGLQRERVVDVGSGAGFPALPFAAAVQESTVDMLESNKRKADFSIKLAKSAKITNARSIAMRAEEWAAVEGSSYYQLALARAVADLSVVLEYAAPMLERGGKVVAWKGRLDVEEMDRAVGSAKALGLKRVAVVPVCPYAGSLDRHLVVFEKGSETPPGFPRRPGVARKRPLGA